MNEKAYEISGERQLVEIPFESLSPAWSQDETHRWIDVEGSDAESLRELLEPLNLHPLVVETCTGPGDGSRFDAFSRELYIEFPVLAGDHDEPLSRVSIICLPTTLLTIHEHPLPGINILQDFQSGDRRLLDASTSGLLYSLFDHIADRMAALATPARAKANEIARALEENPDSVEVGDILGLKGRVGEMVDVLEDIMFCVTRLQTVESSAFHSSRLIDYLRDLAATLQNLHNAADRFEGRLSDLHQQYVMTQQDKMNGRLQILTVISAVFLPLTLLAGIYGMNFDNMPELHAAFGYPAVLGAMAVIAAVMLLIFYWRGWFK